jgi:hypothetical protein
MQVSELTVACYQSSVLPSPFVFVSVFHVKGCCILLIDLYSASRPQVSELTVAHHQNVVPAVVSLLDLCCGGGYAPYFYGSILLWSV